MPVHAIDLSGQVAIVTGSTSGIGRAMAEALATAGASVVLNGLGDPAEIERTRAELEQAAGRPVRYHGADMTKPEQIEALIAFAEREFGRLDILVNNAGVQHVAAVEDFPPEKWDFIMAVNLTAVFHATRAAVPDDEAQGRGPHRQHRLGAQPGRLAVQVGLCRRQARRRRASPSRSRWSSPRRASPATPSRRATSHARWSRARSSIRPGARASARTR
jgi:NAD(P)-dependent dehydrogenase (short-subunit alcohol dehydrogenase family)